ncbi:uncharacterized protein UTRI_00889_B [Ustilago trichophora]|uniref:Uncharacterized protein n=1 Tax=Ustilago trichophora TaxID=86804 RepID=A0A5C3DQS7_9BASI|nr:uncharacterized protein UTRI_00889_B [Ustilago trichophora]
MHFKPALYLTLTAVLLAAFIAPSSAKKDDEEHASKPDGANYACVMKSTSCKDPDHYTSLYFDHPSLTLKECHKDGFIKSWYNRLMPTKGKGQFVNTFYVITPPLPKELQKQNDECHDPRKKHGWSARMVRDLLQDAIDQQTSCEALVRCNNVRDVDEKCFLKHDEI